MDPLPDVLIEPIVRAALVEDLGRAGDITSAACIDADAKLSVAVVSRQPGVVAGMNCVLMALVYFNMVERYDALVADGDRVAPGSVLARVTGNARAILAAERVALNLLGRLSGVASLTATYVEHVAHTRARIIDTRKTTPGLRLLEKYAVRCGGGANHRFGLDDAVLIKDNHVAACGGVAQAVRRARAHVGHMVKIEVEVDTLDQFHEALSERPDIVMLDNFSLDDLAEAVRIADRRVVLEASGGVNLRTVRAIAETGVDLISVGALTHSAPVLDIGLDVI
jgi:nicotinate-nucleotide pyrophosphorylase (carboxylating)